MQGDNCQNLSASHASTVLRRSLHYMKSSPHIGILHRPSRHHQNSEAGQIALLSHMVYITLHHVWQLKPIYFLIVLRFINNKETTAKAGFCICYWMVQSSWWVELNADPGFRTESRQLTDVAIWHLWMSNFHIYIFSIDIDMTLNHLFLLLYYLLRLNV